MATSKYEYAMECVWCGKKVEIGVAAIAVPDLHTDICNESNIYGFVLIALQFEKSIARLDVHSLRRNMPSSLSMHE